MSLGDARAAGASTFAALRVSLAKRVAAQLRRDPELLDTAVEVGIVDRKWLDEPGQHPISTATPLAVVQRFLERSAEQRPSALASIGLNAIQALSWRAESEEGVEGAATTELTVVFTDLEGFTRYTAQAGDDAAIALLADHHRVVGPIVRSRGGRVVKRLGDGLMLSFPSPEAGVLAALELVPVAPEPLRLRAGVHCGEALVTRDDLIGHVVNVAARVAESARGGQVVVTDAVRRNALDLPGVVFTRPRRRAFKGIDEAIAVSRAERA
jgi:adenylate cyclase